MMSIEEIFEGLTSDESLSQETTDRVLQVEQELHDTLLMQDSTIARLRSLVEATETDLFDQKKKRRRLEKANAAHVKRWAELGEALKTHRSNICLSWNIDDTIDLMKKLQEGR